MVCMLLNNILCYLDVDMRVLYIMDFSTGNSLLFIVMLYVISLRLNYCNWHRYIITANAVNLTIAVIDSLYMLPCDNIQLLCIYHFIASIFIILAVISHIKDIKHNKFHEPKTKDTQTSISWLD